jgi:hypothetical protein
VEGSYELGNEPMGSIQYQYLEFAKRLSATQEGPGCMELVVIRNVPKFGGLCVSVADNG